MEQSPFERFIGKVVGDLTYVEVNDITYSPNERQRQEIRSEDLNELMRSIQDRGLINPITINVLDWDKKPYELIAGMHRYIACRELGMLEIPCRVYYGELPSYERKFIELHENIKRTNLTESEEAQAIGEINEIMALIARNRGERHTQTDTAIMLGISQPKVSQSVNYNNQLKAFIRNNPDVDITSMTPSQVQRDLKRAEAMMVNQIAALKAEAAKGKLAPNRPTHGNKPKAPAATKSPSTMAEAMAAMAATITSMATGAPSSTIEPAAPRPVSQPVMADPHKMYDLIESYVLGDFFENDLDSEQFAFVECDPPYGIDLPELRDADYKGQLNQEYKEIEAAQYPEFMGRLCRELYRLTTPHSFVIMWHSITFNHMINSELEKAGFKIMPHHLGIWMKGATAGQSRHPDLYLGYSCEYFVMAWKGNAKLGVNKLGRSNVFNFNKVPPTQKYHPTERPIALMNEILDTFASPKAQVLVPFAGSGVTLLAAGMKDMPSIGFDLSDEFRNGFINRVFSAPEFKQLTMDLK